MPQSEREAVRRSLAERREQILVKPEPKPSILHVPQLCLWVDLVLTHKSGCWTPYD
jgi:hypothetical protein